MFWREFKGHAEFRSSTRGAALQDADALGWKAHKIILAYTKLWGIGVCE